MNEQADAARRLRERIESAPAHTIDASLDELVSELAPPGARENGEARRYAQALLVQHGIRAQPPLPRAEAGARPELRATRGYALQGAAAVAVAAVFVGSVGYWVYGAALGLVGLLALLLVWRGFGWLDRHVPRVVPRGRVMGGLVALLLVGVAGAAVVLPVRDARKTDINLTRAKGFVAEADAAIDQGRFEAARSNLQTAESIDPAVPLLDAVRAKLTVAEVRALLDQEDLTERSIPGLEQALEQGDEQRVLEVLRRALEQR